MHLIYAGICFFVAIAGMIFIKSMDLGAVLTIAIVVPLVLLVIDSLARIEPKKPEAEKNTNK